MLNKMIWLFFFIPMILGGKALLSEDTTSSETSINAKKKIDLIASFDIADFGVFENSFDQNQIDLKIHTTVPEIEKVFFTQHVSEKVIIFNTPIRPDILSRIPKEKLIYFLWEPWEISAEYFDSYDKVFTWDDDLVDNKKFFKIHYPTLIPMLPKLTPFEEKKLCVMVCGSDIDPKQRNNDLYSERIRMVEFFETKPKGEFEIYGKNWKSRVYRDYVGPIPGFHSGPEKINTLDKYKFSICFENTKNINGYVTEKIFCCFAAGCVPVYQGAGNVEKYIPKNCFIDYRDFESKEQMYRFIKSMPKDIYEKYQENIRAFLSSEQAQLFSQAHFDKTLLKAFSI